MEMLEKYQRQFLEQTRRLIKTPISEAAKRAYLAAPRHLFVRRYREGGTSEWCQVTDENLGQHLATLYADRPLVLFGDDDNNILSTISQPSLVLRMLDMLQLQPGQTVFELGTGSGWNAALMGHLVGPEGRVFSVEVISEVAASATEAVRLAGLANVSIVTADGGDGYAAGAPYDRAIFTAGTYDLPRAINDQVREGGLLMAVIKIEGGGDGLFVLRKTRDCFESVDSLPCAFVQLRGKYQIEGLEPVALDVLPDWSELRKQEVSRTRFWWGGKGQESFMWRTMGIRFFLGISEPRFLAFKSGKTDERPKEDHYFGLCDHGRRSLVLAKDDWLIAYGNVSAKEQLLDRVRQWTNLGMPTAASFGLRVYPSDWPVEAGENQWAVKRNESTFLWSLEAGRQPPCV